MTAIARSNFFRTTLFWLRPEANCEERQCVQRFEIVRTDSLKILLKTHDALGGDDRLCELVMIDQLYLNHPGKIFDRTGALRILEDMATTSPYSAHGRIAASNESFTAYFYAVKE